MIERRASRELAGSNPIDSFAKDKFVKPLSILRPNPTQTSVADQSPITPNSATVQNAYRLAQCLQLQNSALMNKNVSMTSPIGAKTPTTSHALLNVLNGMD